MPGSITPVIKSSTQGVWILQQVRDDTMRESEMRRCQQLMSLILRHRERALARVAIQDRILWASDSGLPRRLSGGSQWQIC